MARQGGGWYDVLPEGPDASSGTRKHRQTRRGKGKLDYGFVLMACGVLALISVTLIYCFGGAKTDLASVNPSDLTRKDQVAHTGLRSSVKETPVVAANDSPAAEANAVAGGLQLGRMKITNRKTTKKGVKSGARLPRQVAQQLSVDDLPAVVGLLPLHDMENAMYTGLIHLGSNKQPIEVLFDTGSANLWVPSIACGEKCGKHHMYDHSASSSYVADGRNFSIKYGSGACSGHLSTDSLEFAGIEIDSITFAEIHDPNGMGEGYGEGSMDGLLGLGFPNMAVDKVLPPFNAMVEKGLLKDSIFAMKLGREDGADGELILGGYDTTHFTGDITWIPLDMPSLWRIQMDSLNAVYTSESNLRVSQKIPTDAVVIVDSGTSYFTGPVEDVRYLANLIGAKYDDYGQNIAEGSYFMECSKMNALPDIEFNLGGRAFPIPATEYLVPTEDDPKKCVFTFIPMDMPKPMGPLWIVGDIFMRRYYSIFDYTNLRVGLATAA